MRSKETFKPTVNDIILAAHSDENVDLHHPVSHIPTAIPEYLTGDAREAYLQDLAAKGITIYDSNCNLDSRSSF